MRASALSASAAGICAALAACATVPDTYEQFEAGGGFSMYEIPSPERMAEMAATIERLTGAPSSDSEDDAEEEGLPEEPPAGRLGPEFYLSASGDPSLDAGRLGEWAQRYAAEETIARGYAYYRVETQDTGMGVDNMRDVGGAIAFDNVRYFNMVLTMLPADAEVPPGSVDAASALAAYGESN